MTLPFILLPRLNTKRRLTGTPNEALWLPSDLPPKWKPQSMQFASTLTALRVWTRRIDSICRIGFHITSRIDKNLDWSRSSQFAMRRKIKRLGWDAKFI